MRKTILQYECCKCANGYPFVECFYKCKTNVRMLCRDNVHTGKVGYQTQKKVPNDSTHEYTLLSLVTQGIIEQEAHGPHRSPEKNSSNQ